MPKTAPVVLQAQKPKKSKAKPKAKHRTGSKKSGVPGLKPSKKPGWDVRICWYVGICRLSCQNVSLCSLPAMT